MPPPTHTTHQVNAFLSDALRFGTEQAHGETLDKRDRFALRGAKKITEQKKEWRRIPRQMGVRSLHRSKACLGVGCV